MKSNDIVWIKISPETVIQMKKMNVDGRTLLGLIYACFTLIQQIDGKKTTTKCIN